ncbi:MAG: replication-relaxation family protein [Phycisphaerae bacterium]|nr:replication-relaxation family protein [Phycisphaerae bacterium]
MAFQFSESDQELLVTIAEHRLLTIRHLTMLLRRNASALRRRLKILRCKGLIEVGGRPFGRSRGRPEILISLGDAGVELLKARRLLKPTLPVDKVTAKGISCVDHELLVNDFRAGLAEMARVVPALSIRFFSANSRLLACEPHDRPFIHETIFVNDGTLDDIDFIPDGVLAITHAELGKTLLFFLEADRGTEPRNSTLYVGRGFRQKIFNYQRYIAVEQYKRYEKILKSELRGFRLLILTEQPARFAALCELVRATPPSGFIWLADRTELLSEGLWASIWLRGGNIAETRQSILGSKALDRRPEATLAS